MSIVCDDYGQNMQLIVLDFSALGKWGRTQMGSEPDFNWTLTEF